MHTTGGYSVGTYITTKWVFDLKEEDTYWCTADIGWVTGHSYIVYGPLQNGATSLMYEGAPNFPEPDRFWSIIDRHKVNIFYTAPTAIRTFIKWGDEWPKKHKLDSLRLLGTVGEPINPEAWMWYREVIGHNRCPDRGYLVADRNRPHHDRADSWCDCDQTWFRDSPVSRRRAGDRRPWMANRCLKARADFWSSRSPGPACCAPSRRSRPLREKYWSQIPGMYFTGDGARKDKDGYFWIMGRVDDVINVSGHRLSTMEVESALVAHEAVAEAAVVGRPDEIKGQAISAFVTLAAGKKAAAGIERRIAQMGGQRNWRHGRPTISALPTCFLKRAAEKLCAACCANSPPVAK